MAPGDILDGYRLIRLIGRGGFGEVWLCQIEATDEFRAFKLIPSVDVEKLERELDALKRYRSVAVNLHSPHLLQIEHVNRTRDGLFYTMPLADGMTNGEPISSDWEPKTLATLIRQQRNAPNWFSGKEISDIMVPLVSVVEKLNDAGVVHRDIKPENILFINGCPCLGDVGLLTQDSATLSRKGTPGYSAPSWYLETGGKPDMWGLATTLYMLLTGNVPDKIGRAIYLYPPQGKEAVDANEWDRLHQIILRAMAGEASERFVRLADFGSALRDSHHAISSFSKNPKHRPAPVILLIFFAAAVLSLGSFMGWSLNVGQSSTAKSGTPESKPASTYSNKAESEHSPKATDALYSEAERDAAFFQTLVGDWDFFYAPMEGVSTTYYANGTYKSTLYFKSGEPQIELGTWKVSKGTLIETPNPQKSPDGSHRVSVIKIVSIKSGVFEGIEKGETIRMFRHQDGREGD